jgi:hypothetical protein
MTTQPTAKEMNGHELLLAMAGRIPDSALAAARRLLAHDQTDSAFTLLAEVLGQTAIPLTNAELAAVRILTGNAALAVAHSVPAAPEPNFVFDAYDESGSAARNQLDDALVEIAERRGGALMGIWRSWRYPQSNWAEPDQGPPIDAREDPLKAYPVYLIQVDDPGAIQAVAAEVLSVVPESANAGIEIIAIDQEPPPYQRSALSESLLLWARADEPEFEIARVFDFADPITGPGFESDHRVIDDPVEIERLGAYLRGGYLALVTATTMQDVLDPEAGAVVPASYRTDGRWVWTDSVTYYLDRHGMAPDPRLSEHIETQIAGGVTVPEVDPETAIEVVNFLLYPAAGEQQAPVWYPGGGRAA